MRAEVHAEMAAVQGEHWWFVARRRVLAAVIARLGLPAQAQAQILEIGCGSGGNLAMLAGFGELRAVESDATARATAQALQLCPVQAGALPDRLALEDGGFDLVCLLDVLEHVADDQAAIERVARLLAQRSGSDHFAQVTRSRDQSAGDGAKHMVQSEVSDRS